MVLMKGDTTTMAEDAAMERSMQIEGLDHLVLTVGDVGRTRDFYERVLTKLTDNPAYDAFPAWRPRVK
jgi:hypothetical protein